MSAQEWLTGHSFKVALDKLIRQFEVMLVALLFADSTADEAAHQTLPLRMGTSELRTFVTCRANSTASGVRIIRRGKMELYTSGGMTLTLSARMCCAEAKQMTGTCSIISTAQQTCIDSIFKGTV